MISIHHSHDFKRRSETNRDVTLHNIMLRRFLTEFKPFPSQMLVDLLGPGTSDRDEPI